MTDLDDAPPDFDDDYPAPDFDDQAPDEPDHVVPQPSLARLINTKDGGRPPWAWSNLTPEEAAELDAALSWWVHAFNENLALEPGHVIPACWRQHPPLLQEIPVQYWGWWAAHRDPRASPLVAMDYYGRHLPGFRDRVSKLIGKPAPECRKGRHGTDTDLATAVRAAEPSVVAHPGALRAVTGQTFGV